jgi:nitrogen fixation/metabolism regulation signal transduction histidine kinase
MIVSLTTAFAYVLIEKQLLFLPVSLVLLIVLLVTSLIRYIERSNKDLTHLLLSIRSGGFTETFTSRHKGTPFKELSDAMNDVVSEFSKLNVEKELHYQYLQALTENISIGILSFEPDGKIVMMNPGARQLLKHPSIKNLSDLKKVNVVLYETILRLESERHVVVTTFIDDEKFQIDLQLREIKLQEKLFRIVLLQNLDSQLEEKEIEAWHQLMSVLTHEIMNSVTPILSLSTASETIMSNADGSSKPIDELDAENVEDIFSSLTTISARSKGLLSFVNAYKAFARPVNLNVSTGDIVSLCKRIIQLITPDLKKFNIVVNVEFPEKSLMVPMDEALIEQVLINILKNAMEAVSHDSQGSISISLEANEQRIWISIGDNGSGMDSETLARVFIPFYTTKQNGTGIGLSLSRQIVRAHQGRLRVSSSPGSGSRFTIELPGVIV